MRVSVPVSRILAVKEPKPHIRVSIARAQHKLADLAENRPKVIAQLGSFGLCEAIWFVCGYIQESFIIYAYMRV